MPRLKVLQKLAECDTWVILDDVQFAKREWQNRARLVELKPPNRQFWLTIPVHLSKGQQTKIRDVIALTPEVTFSNFWTSIKNTYKGSEFWSEVNNYVEALEPSFKKKYLVDIAISSTEIALELFSQKPKLLRSHQISAGGRKSLLMANICTKLGANTYISDSGSVGYLDEEHFSNTTIVWQNWIEPDSSFAGVGPWRNISFIGFLAVFGPDRLQSHLENGEFGSKNNMELFHQ